MGCTLKFCLVFVVLACTSCNTPQPVAEFAASADRAVEQGPPLFRDLYGSCTRARLDRQPVEPIFKGRKALEPNVAGPFAACAKLKAEGDALVTDSAAFGDYFKTIHDLAAFDTSAVTSPSTNAAAQAATTANLTFSQVTAVSKLAGLVAQAAAEHYRRSRLLRYLGEANPSVIAAAEAFRSVARDYEGMLDEERRALRARYQDASGSADAAIVLLLNHAYSEDLKDLDQRKAAADAYIAALQQISEGHQKLASNNVKRLGPVLEPYTSKLNQLIPRMQNAFSEPRPQGSGL